MVKLALPPHANNFGDLFAQHISTYRRLGNYGAEMDSQYYFQRITGK